MTEKKNLIRYSQFGDLKLVRIFLKSIFYMQYFDF